MGFRIRKSIKIMPGVRMTFSPSGVSDGSALGFDIDLQL
jgi:hypothetical protein